MSACVTWALSGLLLRNGHRAQGRLGMVKNECTAIRVGCCALWTDLPLFSGGTFATGSAAQNAQGSAVNSAGLRDTCSL